MSLAEKDGVFSRVKDNYQFFLLFVLCLIFICFKIPNLNLPFFWDESWVYGPAIKAMAKSEASLLPGALSDNFSRGHPLLFFCTGALWVKVFGESFISFHVFALTISISFVFVVFYIVKRIFDSNLALIVTAITIVQPVFYAQSAIALPEMFLSVWAILTIYHFVKRKWAYYFLFGSLMMLTKESGIAVIAALMLYPSTTLFLERISWFSLKLFVKESLLAFFPLVVFMIFLLIQHYQRGYYFFPEHMAVIKHDWGKFKDTLEHCYDILLDYQGRTFITWSFLVAFALFYKPIPIIIRCGIVLSLMICVKVFFRFWPMPVWFTVGLLIAVTLAYYYFVHIRYANKLKETDRFLAVIFIVGIIYFIFSSVNVFTNRYLFILTPLMVLYLGYYIKESLSFEPSLIYYWAIAIMAIGVYNGINYGTFENLGDDWPSYTDAVKLEHLVVNYMEQQHLQKNKVYCNFTMSIALRDKGAGYLSSDTCFSNTVGIMDTNTQYAIYSNIDWDTLWAKNPIALPHFSVMKKIDYGIAHSMIFKRM